MIVTHRWPIRLKSFANIPRSMSRGAAFAHAAEARQLRSYVYLALRAAHPRPWGLPLTITITRIAPRVLDDDNMARAAKNCRDGCADWIDGHYGHGNDRRDGLTWRYAQRSDGVRTYAVEITLSTEEALCPHCGQPWSGVPVSAHQEHASPQPGHGSPKRAPAGASQASHPAAP